MAFPTSNLSLENVLRDVHDPVNQALRTNANATIIVPGGLEVSIDQVDDSIRIGDGVNLITSTNVSGKQGLDVNVISPITIGLPPNASTETTSQAILTAVQDVESAILANPLPANAATETSLLALLAELEQKTEPAQAQNIRALSSATDSVDVPALVTTNSLLTDIEAALSAPLNVNLDAFTASPDSVQLVGSIDGTPSGVKYGFVNNIRQQILAAQDRESDIEYADFGTKDQRVTKISYTSATFPGITLEKQLTYTLVGNRYRRDSINWVVI